jgi:prepilin-type N-terminal cleavage/methylation domain-containing protein
MTSRSVIATLRRGFSLIELLVVISLLGLLVAISFPFLATTLQSTAVNAAQGQVSNALSAARVYATRQRPFVAARQVNNTLRTADDNGDGFSGAIALFAPDNSIRILENDQNAYDPALASSAGWLELQVPPLNGYTPIEGFEDISYPSRVQALGIVRTGNGPYDVQLIPPPFAIRVSSDGTLAQGHDDTGDPWATPDNWDRLVYVSPDGREVSIGNRAANEIVTTQYDVELNRDSFGNTLDLDEYGYRGELRMDDGRVALPIGVVETVSGVLLIEPERVPAQVAIPATFAAYGGLNPADTNFSRDRFNAYTPDESVALMHWASENGSYARILLFNRYTGQDLTR